MRLLKQMIERKLDRYNEFMTKREYLKGIWCFYCAFNLSVSYLNKELSKKEIKIRNKIWKRICVEESDGEMVAKKLRIFLNMISQDMAIVIEAINTMEIINIEEYDYGEGVYNNPKDTGILAYEFEDLN